MSPSHRVAAELTRERLRHAMSLGDGLRAAWRERVVRGTFVIELPTPRTVRALALAGFEFVVLDLEHSPYDGSDLAPLVAEAHLMGIPVLVRPWTSDAGLLGKILDLGVNGVLIPHVGSAAEARAVVDACRYSPAGSRGVCPLIGTTAFDDPVSHMRDAVLVVVQIEGTTGLENVAEIAAVDGVDCLFVGPYDLSHALGTPGEHNGSGVTAAAAQVADAVPPGLALGVYVDDPAQSQRWAKRGFHMQCVGFDGRMLMEQARRTLDIAADDTTPTLSQTTSETESETP